MIPCPLIAASPWISTPNDFYLLVSFVVSWIALTLPYTNGLTASRCEGLGRIERVISLSPNFFLVICPKWYLTSPENESSSYSLTFSKNYLKMDCAGLSKTQWRVLILPLWAIPRTKFYIPDRAAVSTSSSKAEVAEFKPSTPNLL